MRRRKKKPIDFNALVKLIASAVELFRLVLLMSQ